MEEFVTPSLVRMNASKSGLSRRLMHRCAQGLIGLLWLVMVTGCASQYGTLHQAHECPPGLIAPPSENTQTLDLSKLSPNSGNTNVIGPGDLLDVTIAASMSPRDIVTFPARVEDNGNARVGLIGVVKLGGLELEDAEERIARASIESRIFNSPMVTVGFKRKRMNRVTVIGAVKSPGTKMLPSSESDLLSAIVAAGGLADDAGVFVEIRNVIEQPANDTTVAGGTTPGAVGSELAQTGYAGATNSPKNVRIDLVSAAKKGSNGYYIADGGVVMIEKRDPKAVQVTGLVRKPGKQDFPVDKEFTLLDALSQAGWTSSQVADKVYVIRQLDGTPEPSVIECSIRRSKFDLDHNLRLAPGDIVSVEHTPATVVLEALNIMRIGLSASLNPFLP